MCRSASASYATAKLGKLVKLDQKTIRIDVEVTLERNPRQSGQRERVELTIYSRGPVIRAEAAADDRFPALDLAPGQAGVTHMRRACDRRKPRKPAHTVCPPTRPRWRQPRPAAAAGRARRPDGAADRCTGQPGG